MCIMLTNRDFIGEHYPITHYVNGDECKGQKRSKERVTFLAITNWDGSDKRRLIVIGKPKNPQCFKNIKSLPVRYANRTTWMQTDIFYSNTK